MEKKKWLIVLVIFLFAFFLRLYSFYPDRFIFGYDQVEDLLYTKKIVFYHDPVIIGRGIYGNPNIHHGVFFFYYLVFPYLIGGGSPIVMAIWNSFFNSLAVVVIFLLGWELFGCVKVVTIALLITSVSYQLVQYASWLSNPTTTIFLVPLFFLNLWYFLKGRKWFLVSVFILLGLIIQAQLFMLYLVFIIPIYWLIYKPKFPGLKIILFSLIGLAISLSTMILTEVKLRFVGLKSIINFPGTFDEAKTSLIIRLKDFSINYIKVFSINLWPEKVNEVRLVGLFIIIFFILYCIFWKNKKETRGLIFLLIYLLSPLLMLPFGYHDKPWTFIGIAPVVALLFGFLFTKLKSKTLLITLLILIIYTNIAFIIKGRNTLLFYINQEAPSILINQIAVMDYTYQESGGQPFAINSVTYPLYFNNYWSYHYPWYGLKKYGYLPTWLGGNQLYPYDSLRKPSGHEIYAFMIIDNSSAIPWVHRLAGKQWVQKNGKLIEEREIGGYTVIKFKTNAKN